MTSATTEPARRAGGRHAEGHGYGMVIFAAVLLLVIGCFNLIDGIAAIANSHVFTANAHYVVGNQIARWFAVIAIGLNAIAQMFFIPAYPFWSLMIIAVDVVALWGLCAYGSRANLQAA